MMVQSRIQRPEYYLQNLRLSVAQKCALLKERRQLCLDKGDEVRWDIGEVDDIRKQFEELKCVYVERSRRRMCAIGQVA